MNIDFHVKEVGAEVYEVSINVATRDGLKVLLDFLMTQTKRKPYAGKALSATEGERCTDAL